MIIQGKNGCVCLYWKDLLISSIPLGRFKLEHYMKESEKFIIESMTSEKKNIREIVFYTKNYCEIIYKRKVNKKRLNSDDHTYFQLSLLSLIRMKLIDFEDVCFIAPRRK